MPANKHTRHRWTPKGFGPRRAANMEEAVPEKGSEEKEKASNYWII
ncbi:MAG TPA: hypothetical protein P5560_10210 [Thermotogota bacterium]|nr:hypothetical protein [Thermotogota bacterium]